MTTPDDPAFDAYKTLQVDSEADPEVIQAAYRRLAQKWHPDLASGPEAEDRMVAINRAWEIVGDPDRRAEYDKERAKQVRAARLKYAGRTDAGRDTSWPSAEPPATKAGPVAAKPPTPGAAGTAGARAGAAGPAGTGAREQPRQPVDQRVDEVPRDWTPGRSTIGGKYDPASMRTNDTEGGAGPPPGNPSGSLVTFGRYNGWSIGEIARTNLEFLEWLDRMPIGRPYRGEIDVILRQTGRRRSSQPEPNDKPGLFRRR
jgi:curved DNA-binding protein CbpA